MMDKRTKAGQVLTIFGVSAWAPFLILVGLGKEPSIFPFLVVHLTGIIGGARLRAAARPADTKKPRRRTVLGRIMILLGVAAWAPYLYQKHVLGLDLEIGPYLATHLSGVLGGSALLLSLPLTRLWVRWSGSGELHEDTQPVD